MIPAKTLSDLQWPKILEALASRAKTDLGRARSLARPFLADAGEVEEELARVEELRALAVGEQVTLPLWGVRDVGAQLDRASKGGTLEPTDLIACAAVVHALLRVRDFLESRSQRLPRAWAVASRIAELGKLATRVERSFDSGGAVADRASPELFELRERARGLHRGIKTKLDQLLHDAEFTPLLRETYFTIRNERYVVPVLAGARSQVPGIVHNASQSGQTLFVEPQILIGLGNELAIAQSLVVEEERRLLLELSGLFGAQAAALADSLAAAAELDAVEAAARLAIDLEASPPTIAPADAPFRLLALRHPLLALREKSVVPNDVAFGPESRVLVVSGPNAGGKTVTLAAVGLSAVMLRAGLPVAAEKGSSLPLFADVHAAVGDDQDLSKDLSTFSAHLATLKEIAGAARKGSLVLVDEIAADTDPREGAAIALAVLDDLVERGARAIVTTHLDELKAVALTDPRYVNARVGFDPKRLAPTYRLEMGSPGSSSAIEIARRIGLDPKVCDRAEETLKSSAGPLGQALLALERERADLARARTEFDEARARAEAERAELERLQESVRRRERAIESEARRELVREVEAARAEVAALLASLQAAPTIRGAVEAQARLARTARDEEEKLAVEAAMAKTKEEERLPAGSPVAVGMRVRIARLDKDAEVLEIEGDDAVVAAGAMKLRSKISDLVPLKGAPRAARAPKRSREESMRAAEAAGARPVEAAQNRCDVRGMRADDALKAVETFLDRCYGEGQPGAVVVHGLGSGALKATVRDYLKSSPYVKGFRAGADHEGGEGTTVVELKG